MNTATSIKDIGIANLADYFASGWNTRNIGGFIFDEQFQIEGIPLSWFLKRLLSLHTIPPQLQVKPKIEKMLNGESVTYTAKDRLRTKVLTKLFFTNENIKLMGGRKIRTTQPSSRHPLLFLTYLEHINQQTGEIYRLQKLLHHLQEKNKQEPLVIGASPQSESFIQFLRQKLKKRPTFPLLYDYITTKETERAKIISQNLQDHWEKLEEEKKIQLFRSAEQWNCLRAVFDFYVSLDFLYFLILYFEIWKSILKDSGVKVAVITSQNSIFERCLNAAASRLGITTVLLQHGAAMGSINPELLEPYKIAVFSQKYQKNLCQQGVAAENISIVGPLIFDEIYLFIQREKRPPTANILLLTVPFIEQGIFSQEEHFSYIQKILQQSASIPNNNITIKLHPREKYFKKYERLAQQFGRKNISVIQDNQRKVLYGLMDRSDVIINFSSTTAVEAMILDKPLITITFPHFQNPFSEIIKSSQASVEVEIKDDLAQAIHRVLDDKGLQWSLRQYRHQFVKEYCGRIDGKATERAALLLQRLASASSKKES